MRIELLYYPKPGTVGKAEARPMNQPGLAHFAVRVSSLDDAVAKLVSLGGKVVEGTRIYSEEFQAHLLYLTDRMARGSSSWKRRKIRPVSRGKTRAESVESVERMLGVSARSESNQLFG